MGLMHRLDLDKVTFGDLYRFADHARAAGISPDDYVTVETTDPIGNPIDHHTLVADLGGVDEVSRPIVIDRTRAALYAQALGELLTGEADETDRDFLNDLASELLELPLAYKGKATTLDES
ncbi:hypothetical protein B0I33_104510 [Prauserella shujinwangii]|uniref:Uncharacterized protein n=1 Tax=Prauserella shujinwangii TaxID=1453103 RepID=A0A2T0LXE3_9PSEU|nr:hypothetical protein [Prauserella shujinwangii]PRX48692.1 hypothetical protein B0I33_104510 [Prauserella shujinwangii]